MTFNGEELRKKEKEKKEKKLLPKMILLKKKKHKLSKSINNQFHPNNLKHSTNKNGIHNMTLNIH